MKGAKQYKLAQTIAANRLIMPSPFSEETWAKFRQQEEAHLRKAAYAGHPEAQYFYALYFDDESDLIRFNKKKSWYWYQKSAAQNFFAAVNNLAHFQSYGWCCKSNNRKALALYKRAGKLGSKVARRNVRILQREIAFNQYKLRNITGWLPSKKSKRKGRD